MKKPTKQNCENCDNMVQNMGAQVSRINTLRRGIEEAVFALSLDSSSKNLELVNKLEALLHDTQAKR